jgi:SAM-dependent methyltransferase
LGDVDFELRRCEDCQFEFKDPIVDAEKLLACYAAADAGNWDESPDPWQRKFDVFRDVLQQHARGRRVLDVGCFNGAMLEYFGNDWDRFGVEPSLSAAELAGKRGIRVLSDTLENLPAGEPAFDAIMAIDVLEHVTDPMPFFRLVSKCLAPGGVFIAVTGDTDASAWRWQGSMYWYCSLPEHVSFYNRAALEKAGGMTGMEVIYCSGLCHKRLPRSRHFADSAKSAVYVAGRSVGGFGVPALRRRFVERRGPTIQSAKDHLLAVLRKV